jgi:Adenylate cyclase, family 3 (some proteins contain HAMP domain)
MAEIVVEHLGMIDKFQGDAVMVVFGAPDPIDDHAERALRCAIAMQRRQASSTPRDGAPTPWTACTSGLGVNTGQVIAGVIGGGGRLEYTVIGDAVNVAQRLQSEAEGGEIVASSTTIASAPGISSDRSVRDR